MASALKPAGVVAILLFLAGVAVSVRMLFGEPVSGVQFLLSVPDWGGPAMLAGSAAVLALGVRLDT